jgi:hypothetical protein
MEQKILDFFFRINQVPNMIGYIDAGYFSYPHNAISQTGFCIFA